MRSRARLADQVGWIETSATVVSCRYQFARLNTLTLGVQTGKKFRIAFEYYAHGRLYSGEFQSAVAIAQKTTVSLWYNPLRPQENTFTQRAPTGDGWVGLAIAASIVFSLLCLSIFRGCS